MSKSMQSAAFCKLDAKFLNKYINDLFDVDHWRNRGPGCVHIATCSLEMKHFINMAIELQSRVMSEWAEANTFQVLDDMLWESSIAFFKILHKLKIEAPEHLFVVALVTLAIVSRGQFVPMTYADALEIAYESDIWNDTEKPYQIIVKNIHENATLTSNAFELTVMHLLDFTFNFITPVTYLFELKRLLLTPDPAMSDVKRATILQICNMFKTEDHCCRPKFTIAYVCIKLTRYLALKRRNYETVTYVSKTHAEKYIYDFDDTSPNDKLIRNDLKLNTKNEMSHLYALSQFITDTIALNGGFHW